ncbi:hypothetical protein ABIA73_002187 [Stenotrophomonas sp. 2694]
MRNQLDVFDHDPARVAALNRSTAGLVDFEKRSLVNRSVVEYGCISSSAIDKVLDVVKPLRQSFCLLLSQHRTVIGAGFPVSQGIRPKFALNRGNVSREPRQPHAGFWGHCVQSGNDGEELVRRYFTSPLGQLRTNWGMRNEPVFRKGRSIEKALYRSNPHPNLCEFSAQKAKKHLFLSFSFGSQLHIESLSLLDSICQPNLSNGVGFLTQQEHRKGGKRGDADASNSNCDSQHGYHYGPCIPPNDAVTNTGLHAWADSIPQLLPTTHFPIPLWTGRHSAMTRQPEACRA